MRYAKITSDTMLTDVSDRVGQRNLAATLHLNNMKRVPEVGKHYMEQCKAVIKSANTVDWKQKKRVLATLSDNSDVFETASLLGQAGWKLLNSTLSTFPGYYRIPDEVDLPLDVDMLGDGQRVTNRVYSAVMAGLDSDLHDIDPAVFARYDSRIGNVTNYTAAPKSGAMRYFKLPFGEVTLHSSISGESVDFPCYPEGVTDAVRASFSQMPDMLYQYEPWVVYYSSGPRINTYVFDIHRDMWDDHNNQKANSLIRFCEANCYPQYNGSAVHASICTLYVKGRPLIRGVVTEVSTEWDGPIGHDGFYLHVKLSITIQEVSRVPLNYDTVRSKSIIG